MSRSDTERVVAKYDTSNDHLTIVRHQGKTKDQPVCLRFDLILDDRGQDRIVGIRVHRFREAYRRFRNEKHLASDQEFQLSEFLEFMKLDATRLGDDEPAYQGHPAQLDFSSSSSGNRPATPCACNSKRSDRAQLGLFIFSSSLSGRLSKCLSRSCHTSPAALSALRIRRRNSACRRIRRERGNSCRASHRRLPRVRP